MFKKLLITLVVLTGMALGQTVHTPTLEGTYTWPGSDTFIFGNLGFTTTPPQCPVGTAAGGFTATFSPNCVQTSAITSGWFGTLAASQGISDTTLVLTSTASIPSSGYFFIGAEYEQFTGNNTSTNTLTGVTRGHYFTTPAAHNTPNDVYSVDMPLQGSTQVPWGGIFSGTTLALNNGFPTSGFPLVINSGGNEFDVHSDGTISQAGNDTNYLSPIEIGVPSGRPDGTDDHLPLTDSSLVLQDNNAHEMNAPFGTAVGISGLVTSIPPAAIGAPLNITPVFLGSGSCSITYEVTGVDVDGVEIPGSTASITGITSPWSTPSSVKFRYPPSAGVVSYNAYRTAASGCTGIALGKFASTTGNYGTFTDFSTGGDSTVPPTGNNSVAKSCVGSAANHELYCHLSGASSTPPVACGSSVYGWDYTNTSAATSATLHCYSGATTWVATDTTGASSVHSVNGDTTAAQVIQGGGVITCSTTSGITTCTAAGGGLTGAVNTGAQYQDMFYAAGGTTASPLTHRYTVPVGQTAAQVAAQFSGTSNSTVTIQNGDFNHFPFVNTTNWVNDSRADIPTLGWNVKQSGAQCDMQQDTASVSSGTATLTITGGNYSLQTSDAGDPTTHLGNKAIEIVGLVAGVPTVFDASIIGVSSSTSATLSANSPFSLSNYSVYIGHDDTAAFLSAIGLWQGRNMEITLPSSGTCWTSTVPLQGQSMGGVGHSASTWVGKAGRDVLAANDPTNGGFVANGSGQHIHDMTIGFDARIDSTKPWSLDNNGTTTVQTPTYRPWGILTYLANNPLGYGWIQGAQNGIAAVTNGSNVMCLPSGIALPPISSQPIFFPYQAAGTSIFKTTVSSYAGSCGSGSPVTLGTAWTPPTNTQAEWFTGTSVQTISTAISSGTTINTSNPLTITLANNINPTPLNQPYPGSDTLDSNVAPFGTVIIDGEQFTYFGTSAYPASTSTTYTLTLTGRAQNGTTAASHSTGAIIAPLNPYHPTWPWPVFNTSGGSPNGITSTPATAEYFPGLSSGVSAISFANYNGADWAGGESVVDAIFQNLAFQQYPQLVLSGENGVSFQIQNSTTCMYIVALPFHSRFENVDCYNAQMGFIEGAPAINQNNYFANGFPTGDSNVWYGIGVHSAAFPFDFVGGGSQIYDGWQTFSQNGGTIGMSNYPAVGAYSGAGSGWMWSGTYGDAFIPGIQSGSKYLNARNFYIELETGGTNGLIPAFRFGCLTICQWTLNPNGGGVGFITGLNNTFDKGVFPNQGAASPMINLGTNTVLDHVAGLGSQLISNTYGISSYLSWGLGGYSGGTVANGDQGGIGPYGNLQVGSQAPVFGQTAHAFETGNDANPEVSADSANIFPYEFGLSGAFDANPFLAVVHDDTAPVSASYVSCNVLTSGGCTTFQFNQGGRIAIGPSQRLSFQQYVVHYAFETPAGANVFLFNVGAVNSGTGCTGIGTLLSKSITTSGTGWLKGQATVDLSGLSGTGCLLTLGTVNSATNTQVRTAYVIMAPVWTSIDLAVPSDSIYHTSCSVNGRQYGTSSTGYTYTCVGGTINRTGPAS